MDKLLHLRPQISKRPSGNPVENADLTWFSRSDGWSDVLYSNITSHLLSNNKCLITDIFSYMTQYWSYLLKKRYGVKHFKN
jgi:hypothetical protein